MLLHSDILELKINELFIEHDKLLYEFSNGKCSGLYFLKNSSKICGEIRGIAYALGYDVESKLGIKTDMDITNKEV